MFKTRGGVKGRLNNVKKTAPLVDVDFPYHKHQKHQYLTFTIICEGDISCTGRSTDRTVNFWAMLPTNVISFWRANWKKRILIVLLASSHISTRQENTSILGSSGRPFQLCF